ncbi:MAG: redoxin domain-containing protein [Planctomycetes bacterium]|nr:redoxin domain-containing protein [Planctomycetota bacterium]
MALPRAGFLLATIAAVHLQLPAQDAPPTLREGAVAPDFAWLDATGREVRLAEYRDKVVVLDFWATWCGPCIASFPHVGGIGAAHADSGVVVLAICTSDSRAKFDSWVAANAAKYPGLVFGCDPFDRSSKDFERRASRMLYGVTGLPTKFVIGRDGRIALTMVGHEDDDARLEAGLARAGVPIDAALSKRGEEQIEKSAREAAAREAELLRNPPPTFAPMFGSVNCGDPIPEFTLTGEDGQPFASNTLRGKPTIVGMAWAEIFPTPQIEAIAARHARYGVRTLGLMVLSTREEFDAWLGEHGDARSFSVAHDPAGKLPETEPPADMETREAFYARTVMRRFFRGNMLPAMPVWFVVDAEGRMVGSFRLGNGWQDGLANLLLRAGVKLEPEDMPTKVAPPEAFMPPKPREAEPKVEPIALGGPAPLFAMTDVEGKPVALDALRGKVVVLDFWATWCGPCMAALPHVQKVAETYGEQGVVIVASCTSDERAKFETWVRANQMNYPDIVFAHDPLERGLERASRKLYGVSGIPMQFVIDREGKLVAAVSGYMNGEVLLDAALAKAGIAVDAAILEQAVQDQKKRDELAARPQPKAMKLR